MTPPSRLWRKLGAQAPLFAFDGQGTWDDARIMSWSTTRGNDRDPYALTASTLTIDIAEEVAPSRDQTSTMRLTDYGAKLVAQKIAANFDAGTIADRWHGRIASQTVTDYSNRKRTTQINGADWSAQFELAPQQIGIVNRALPVVYGQLVFASQADYPAVQDLGNAADWPVIYRDAETPELIDSNDVMGKYGAQIGTLLRTTRHGVFQYLPLKRRQRDAAAWRTTAPNPILRRQALSPATWEQPATSPAKVAWSTRDSAGTVIERVTTVSAGERLRPVRMDPVDNTHVKDVSGQVADMMTARAWQASGYSYRIPSVEFDVLELLSSPKPEDRSLAGQLLRMEHGDPIAISYDWPQDLPGMHFATQIVETVTPSEWRIRLGLMPHNEVVGTESPATPGHTWDTAYRSGVTWDSIPAGKTWQGAP